MLICPHRIDSTLHAWTLRTVGIFCMFVGFTFGPTDTLSDTKLIRALTAIYPTWQSVIIDVVVFIFSLSIIALVLYVLLISEKKHHASKKIVSITRWIDNRIIKNLLTILSWITRTGIALVIALSIMNILQITKFEYVPSFDLQPVVFSIATIGIVCFVESFAWWQNKLHRLFCITTKN